MPSPISYPANSSTRPLGAILLVAFLVAGCGTAATTESPAESKTANDPNASGQGNEKTGALKLPFTEQELRAGWISLFDGQSLYGWQANSNANWEVVAGAIRVSAGEPGLLCTTTEFANFVLQLEFRAAEKTNSGVFVRTAASVGPNDVDRECYEINIAPSENPFPTGSIVKRHKASSVEPKEGWQSLEITALHDCITVKINDHAVAEYHDAKPLGRGRIGLQKNEGEVEFRNLRLKPLGLEKIFNGRDLQGWKEYPDLKSKFTVTPAGEINVKNGRGLLESERSYGDFVLRLECQTNGANLNSGVFFRCIPGQEMNGYESQIHNGYKNNDRAQPLDCGTGGIFRRQNARAVLADDFTWFHETLIVHGAHVAAWVNGVQVSDWTDERPAHENPRQGLRLAPGSLQLQGHDPTTDVSFRELQAAELPPR